MPEILFTMKDLRRVYPPNREVLKGIWLSFWYGAKIGVLGLNGAGKSSLLRIMGGLDDGYQGEVQLQAGRTVGYLSQEPGLDESKTVLEVVEDMLGAVGRPHGEPVVIVVLEAATAT